MLKEIQNVNVSTHPLVEDKLTRMRDESCRPEEFRRLLREISMLMTYEVTSDFGAGTDSSASISWKEAPIKTPMAFKNDARILGGRPPVVVPILRAGLVMAEGLHMVLPAADVGHIGLYRDEETLRPIEYLVKIPAPGNRVFIIVDPIIATGHSVSYAINTLRTLGVAPCNIRVLALICSYHGVKHVRHGHPEISIYAAAVDGVNEPNEGIENGFVIPGIGDAGDRLFGTINMHAGDAPPQ